VTILCGGARPLGEGNPLRERPAADYGLVAAGWKVQRLSPQQIEGSLDICLTLVREAIAQEGDLRKGLGYSSAMGQNLPSADE